jgi:uncharacterized membrane protein YhdT
MNKTLLKTGLKFGLLLFAVNVTFDIWEYFIKKSKGDFFLSLPNWFEWTNAFVSIVVLLFCFIAAHITFNRQNQGKISFAQALLVGLLVATPTFLLSLVYHLQYVFRVHTGMSFGEHILVALGPLLFYMIIVLIICTFDAQWRLNTKAGKKGWESLVPVLNIISLLEIIKKPAWWLLMLFIPLVNIAFIYIIYDQLAQRFGKEGTFAVGLLLLPLVFFPILGLSDAEYLEELPEDHRF